MPTLEHIIRFPTGERQRTPVLLLHGAWHGAWCYAQWTDDFAEYGYETHVMSLPAHGNSSQDRPINLYGIGDYVAALEEIISQITPTPFVIGHSMGGYTLQRYLLKHSLPGAVLLASVPRGGALPFMAKLIRTHPRLAVRMGLTANLKSVGDTPQRFAEEFLTPETAAIADRYYRHIGSESARVAVETCLPIRGTDRVKTPMLVVAAEKDAIFTLNEQRATAKAYGADLIVIPDQGHDLMLDSDALRTAALIRAWLEQRTPL